ncbi:hypothetical protein C8J57DRAFT_1532997 [Mycena rebaudengoi]|nr:hypothetical protein C8J57DRAFT_1532997 [Mycena rebaudengoi]
MAGAHAEEGDTALGTHHHHVLAQDQLRHVPRGWVSGNVAMRTVAVATESAKGGGCDWADGALGWMCPGWSSRRRRSGWFLARCEGIRLTDNRMLRGLLSNCHVLSISQLPPTSYTPPSPIVTDASTSSGSAPLRSALALSIQIAAFRWLTYTHDHPRHPPPSFPPRTSTMEAHNERRIKLKDLAARSVTPRFPNDGVPPCGPRAALRVLPYRGRRPGCGVPLMNGHGFCAAHAAQGVWTARRAMSITGAERLAHAQAQRCCGLTLKHALCRNNPGQRFAFCHLHRAQAGPAVVRAAPNGRRTPDLASFPACDATCGDRDLPRTCPPTAPMCCPSSAHPIRCPRAAETRSRDPDPRMSRRVPHALSRPADAALRQRPRGTTPLLWSSARCSVALEGSKQMEAPSLAAVSLSRLEFATAPHCRTMSANTSRGTTLLLSSPARTRRPQKREGKIAARGHCTILRPLGR